MQRRSGRVGVLDRRDMAGWGGGWGQGVGVGEGVGEGVVWVPPYPSMSYQMGSVQKS